MPTKPDHRGWTIGIDLGGSHFTVGIVDQNGALQRVQKQCIVTAEGAAAIINRMGDVIDQQMQSLRLTRDDLLGVGIGAPGPLDRKSGVIIESYNLQWFNVPLVEKLRRRVQMEVILNGDAIATTYAEWWAGIGQGTRHLVGLTLGTGVGGGMIVDGLIYYGCTDLAGHFGHMIIETDGRVCSCGTHGCLEAYVSASAMVGHAWEKPHALKRSMAWKRIGGDRRRLTAQALYEAAKHGDAFALTLFEETGYYLGVGLASIIHTINPEMIVIGGAVARAGSLLLSPAKREAGRRAFRSAFRRTRIVRARLGEWAGVIGAAGLAGLQIAPSATPSASIENRAQASEARWEELESKADRRPAARGLKVRIQQTSL